MMRQVIPYQLKNVLMVRLVLLIKIKHNTPDTVSLDDLNLEYLRPTHLTDDHVIIGSKDCKLWKCFNSLNNASLFLLRDIWFLFCGLIQWLVDNMPWNWWQKFMVLHDIANLPLGHYDLGHPVHCVKKKVKCFVTIILKVAHKNPTNLISSFSKECLT